MKKLVLLLLACTCGRVAAQTDSVKSGAYHFAASPVKAGDKRASRSFLRGSSPQLAFLEVHVTTQQQGAAPNPPHAQKDVEELIIITEGTMKITVGTKSTTLGKGSLALIPPLEMQVMENVGKGPLTYYVLMFRSNKPMDMARAAKAGGVLFINADSLVTKPNARGSRVNYFERATAMCENLEIHVTQLNGKGLSHAPHAHEATEILLLVEGKSDMMINEKTFYAGAGDLYIANSGHTHGISNIQDTSCKYFAIAWR